MEENLHPAERAELLRDAEWREGRRRVPSGSAEEARLIEEIDARRAEEEEGLMRDHPDFRGVSYRRSADSADLSRRRTAARRHWLRAARRGESPSHS